MRQSEVAREFKKVRNIRPGFIRGKWFGLANAAWETATADKSPWTLRNHADWKATKKLDEIAERTSDETQSYIKRDLPPRDRLASVYFAQTEHDEDQPVHLQILDPEICVTRCVTEYGNPCTRYCPAAVYEIVEDAQRALELQINAANCVHCKTCDIKDPYENINWVSPEGGAGPNYYNL